MQTRRYGSVVRMCVRFWDKKIPRKRYRDNLKQACKMDIKSLGGQTVPLPCAIPRRKSRLYSRIRYLRADIKEQVTIGKIVQKMRCIDSNLKVYHDKPLLGYSMSS